MRSPSEKSSSVMGIVISVLLHGIFFAGCLALDASSISSSPADQNTTEINQVAVQSAKGKAKS